MWAVKTTTISILALGLLAGSSVGVAAQDEEADPMALSAFSGRSDGQEPPQFSMDPDTGLARIVVPTYEVGDPRASGRKVAIEELASVEGDGIVWDVTGASVRIDNDGGAWVGTVRNVTHVQEPAAVTVGSFEEYVGEVATQASPSSSSRRSAPTVTLSRTPSSCRRTWSQPCHRPLPPSSRAALSRLPAAWGRVSGGQSTGRVHLVHQP